MQDEDVWFVTDDGEDVWVLAADFIENAAVEGERVQDFVLGRRASKDGDALSTLDSAKEQAEQFVKAVSDLH